MPLFVHAMPGTLAVHAQSVELPGEADGEIRDIDHLLHLAQPLGEDLAHLHAHQRAQRGLVRAQLVADFAHDLSALGRGDHAPGGECRNRRLHDAFVLVRAGHAHAGDGATGGGVDGGELGAPALQPIGATGSGVNGINFEFFKQVAHATILSLPNAGGGGAASYVPLLRRSIMEARLQKQRS